MLSITRLKVSILCFTALVLVFFVQVGRTLKVPVKYYEKQRTLNEINHFLQINAALLVALPQVVHSQVSENLLQKRVSQKIYDAFHPGVSQPDIYYPDWYVFHRYRRQ